MKSAAFFGIAFLFLALPTICVAQDPLPVIKSNWQPTSLKGQKVEPSQSGPARQIMPEDTLGPRKAREFSTVHPDNPSDLAPDGRRAVIEKNEAEANTLQPDDVKGYTFAATVRNDSSKTVNVIYWEYKFIEKSDPKNVIRRQFLCAVKIKKGAEFELKAFSTLGPTETVSVKTEGEKDKQFDESVRINRIEYSDDDILQRGDWKFADVKAAVDRAVSKPWGDERCRPLLP